MTRFKTVKIFAKCAALTVGAFGTFAVMTPAASAAPGSQPHQTQRAAHVLVKPQVQTRLVVTPRRNTRYVQTRAVQKPVVIQRATPARIVRHVPAPKVIIVTPPKRAKAVVTVAPRRR